MIPIVETKLFSELFGFVVANPKRLDTFHGGSALGLDLLAAYTQTDQGDEVSAAGIAIPLIDLDVGYYSLVFRSPNTPSFLSEAPIAVSTGWILEITDEVMVVCGLGHLSSWNPHSKALRRVPMQNGWYSIEIRWGQSFNDDDFALEFVCSHSVSRPAYAADPSKASFKKADVDQ
ncbi:MAG: hypothetical protein ABW190_08675 [Rhizobacter sp.]